MRPRVRAGQLSEVVRVRVIRRTHLATSVQLAEHVPELHVPKADVLVLRSPTGCEDARDVRVPRQRLDGCRVFMELPQRRVTRWQRLRCGACATPTLFRVACAIPRCMPPRTP